MSLSRVYIFQNDKKRATHLAPIISLESLVFLPEFYPGFLDPELLCL